MRLASIPLSQNGRVKLVGNHAYGEKLHGLASTQTASAADPGRQELNHDKPAMMRPQRTPKVREFFGSSQLSNTAAALAIELARGGGGPDSASIDVRDHDNAARRGLSALGPGGPVGDYSQAPAVTACGPNTEQ